MCVKFFVGKVDYDNKLCNFSYNLVFLFLFSNYKFDI